MKKQSRYKQIYVDGKQWYEHRWIWTKHHGAIPNKMVIHHINGDGRDNRINNLALVTQQENMQKEIGLGYNKVGNKYRSHRVVHGKLKYLGLYGTKCGAVMASRMAYV